LRECKETRRGARARQITVWGLAEFGRGKQGVVLISILISLPPPRRCSIGSSAASARTASRRTSRGSAADPSG
jgi:hypothetical protein